MIVNWYLHLLFLLLLLLCDWLGGVSWNSECLGGVVNLCLVNLLLYLSLGLLSVLSDLLVGPKECGEARSWPV